SALVTLLQTFLLPVSDCLTRITIMLYLSILIERPAIQQRAWPKGKMIEGRSGGSGRSTRRESWAPPDSGSAHRRIAGLYRVPTRSEERRVGPVRPYTL